jgi:hypothetical protein
VYTNSHLKIRSLTKRSPVGLHADFEVVMMNNFARKADAGNPFPHGKRPINYDGRGILETQYSTTVFMQSTSGNIGRSGVFVEAKPSEGNYTFGVQLKYDESITGNPLTPIKRAKQSFHEYFAIKGNALDVKRTDDSNRDDGGVYVAVGNGVQIDEILASTLMGNEPLKNVRNWLLTYGAELDTQTFGEGEKNEVTIAHHTARLAGILNFMPTEGEYMKADSAVMGSVYRREGAETDDMYVTDLTCEPHCGKFARGVMMGMTTYKPLDVERPKELRLPVQTYGFAPFKKPSIMLKPPFRLKTASATMINTFVAEHLNMDITGFLATMKMKNGRVPEVAILNKSGL